MNLIEIHRLVSAIAPIREVSESSGHINVSFHRTATAGEISSVNNFLSNYTESTPRYRLKKTTIINRIIASGKISAIQAFFSQHEVDKMKWDAAEFVWSDNEEVRAVVAGIGCDVDAIFSPL